MPARFLRDPEHRSRDGRGAGQIRGGLGTAKGIYAFHAVKVAEEETELGSLRSPGPAEIHRAIGETPVALFAIRAGIRDRKRREIFIAEVSTCDDAPSGKAFDEESGLVLHPPEYFTRMSLQI